MLSAFGIKVFFWGGGAFSKFNVMDIVDIMKDPERCNLAKNLMAVETALSDFWPLSVLCVHLYILHDVITAAVPTACSN